MRWFILPMAFLVFSLTSCNYRSDRRPDTREAGRNAYRASQELKHDAKKAAQDLRDAGKNFREGWSQAEREDKARKHEPEPRPRDRSDR
jgi:cytochrome c biogenesis protein ResB